MKTLEETLEDTDTIEKASHEIVGLINKYFKELGSEAYRGPFAMAIISATFLAIVQQSIDKDKRDHFIDMFCREAKIYLDEHED